MLLLGTEFPKMTPNGMDFLLLLLLGLLLLGIDFFFFFLFSQVLQEEPPTPRREEEQFAPLPALDLGSLDALQQELDAKVTASYAPVPKPYRPWEDLTPSNTGRLCRPQGLDSSWISNKARSQHCG